MILAIVVIVILAIGVGAAVVLLRPAATPTITLWYNSTGHYGDTEPAVAQLLKAQIEATGKVTINLQSEDWASYRADLAKGNLPMFLLGWYPDYFDTDDYISPFYSTSGAQSQGSFYSNATVDKWVTNESTTVDTTIRNSYFQKLQNQSATDVPYIPLWMTNAHVVYDSDISGVFLHPVVFKYFIMNKPGFDHITVGTTDSPTSFDPALAYDYFSGEIINQVFDTLLVYSPTNGTLLPGLATQVPSVTNGGIGTEIHGWQLAERYDCEKRHSARDTTQPRWQRRIPIRAGGPVRKDPDHRHTKLSRTMHENRVPPEPTSWIVQRDHVLLCRRPGTLVVQPNRGSAGPCEQCGEGYG